MRRTHEFGRHARPTRGRHGKKPELDADLLEAMGQHADASAAHVIPVDCNKAESQPSQPGRTGLDLLDERCVYMEQSGKVFDTMSREHITRKSFGMRGPLYRQWLSAVHDGKRPSATAQTFAPGQPRLAQGRLNMFDPTVIVQPSKEQVWDDEEQLMLFFRLLENLAEGDERDYEYLLWWLAWTYRNPGQKCVALILRGANGTGKGLLSEIVRKIFGKYAVRVGHEQINSRFNGWISECIIALADEISVGAFTDNKAAEAKLKALVTENSVMVEQKGAEAYEFANCTKWLFSANDRVPLTIEPQDRRYSVISSASPLTRSDPALILPMVAATQDPSFIQAIVNYLCTVSLGTFDPQVPHRNAARDAVIEDGLSGPQLWWHQELPPAGRYPALTLHASYSAWCEVTGEKRMAVADLLRARPEAVKTVMAPMDALPEFHGMKAKGQAAKVRCVDVPDLGQGGTISDWAGHLRRQLPRPTAATPAIPSSSRPQAVSSRCTFPVGLDFVDTSFTPETSCVAGTCETVAQIPLEAADLPQDDRVDTGACSPDQWPKRKPQGHFVRRVLDRGFQFGIAVATAFLLAHGVPMLDVINRPVPA